MNYAPGSSVIPFDDTTRTSRVTATIGRTADNPINQVSSTVFNDFFLMFDELGRCLPSNSILVFLQIFISFFQYYISIFLPFLREKWDFNIFPDKILRYLAYPVDFGLGDTDILLSGIPSYTLLMLDLLIVLYFILIIIYHRIYKMFPKHNVYAIRFLLSFLIPIILPPSFFNVGFSFNKSFKEANFNEQNSTIVNQTIITEIIQPLSKKDRSLFIASTFFGILLSLTLLDVFYVETMFRSSTPYIENTPLSMWDGNPYFLCVFGCCMMNVSSRLIERLPLWTGYILISCCVLYNLCILYQMFFFPMIKKYMNNFITIFVSSGIITSLFQLFPIPSLYRIVIPFASFFIFIPVYIFGLRFMKRKIIQQDSSEVKIATENQALRYLRLSIAYKYEDFISFKWIKLMNHFDTPKIISQVAQIISFFPSESQNLTFYISILTKNHQLNFYQRFLLFQIRQVHVLRQSNTSKQLNEDLAEILKVTNRSIYSFSQFLIRIIDERQQLSLDRLNTLAKINRETSSICHEAMARYPNNARLLFIYSRYVIECKADFKTGISLFHEGQMIDRGKRTTIDVAFQSMANLFPNYLWKRILNYKGQIIFNRRHSKSGSSISADSIDNERPSRNSDFDDESNEKIASNVIENPKLRYSLRKAVNNMNSIGIPFLTINAIIRFLLAVIMCIVLMCAAPDYLKKRSINYSSIAQINVFRRNLDLCLFRTAKYWSYNLGLAPKQENITDTLGPGISLNDYNNLTISPSDELFKNVIESIKANEKLGQLFIEVKYKQSANLVGQSSDLIDNSKTDLLHVKNISFCNNKLHKVLEATTSLRYFSLYILNQVSAVTVLNKIYEKPSDWKHDECVCEIILNMHNIVSVLNEQSDVLVRREKIYSDSIEKNLVIIIAIAIPIVFAIFLIPLIAGYFKLNLEFQHIFDVLSLLPIKIYKDASKPIAIFQSEIEPTAEGVTQVEHKGCQKIAIVLPAIISILLITGGLAGVLTLFLDVNKQFYTLVRWLELGSLRTPLVIEVVTHCIFAGIYGYLGSTNYTSHEYHLNMMIDYSRQLLLKHKSLIYGSDQIKSCNGFNDELDDLHFTNTCKLNVNGDTFRENYQCLSLDQQVYSLHKLSNDVNIAMWNAQRVVEGSSNDQEYNEAFRNILNDYESINLHFLGISYLLPKLEKAQNILNDGVFLQVDHLKQYTFLITFLVIIASIIIFIIEMFVMNNLKEELNIVRILIARLPPISVVKNKQLVELIIGRQFKKLNKLSPISINVQNCSNSVIIFNRNFRIQMVNAATSKLFGFTKEQLYQSDISLIISKEDCNIIKEKCNKNCNPNCKQSHAREENETNESMSILENETNEEILSSLLHNYDDNLNNNDNDNNCCCCCLSDQVNLCQRPFTKTIIGVKDDSTQAILSAILTYLPDPDNVFALILTDETFLYINEEDIKQAKQRVNEILNQVLPFEIIQNNHMKDNISFSVKQLSVITIKILNFNDMLPHITSVQAVRNMSELFLSYDTQLLNYQTLTKTCVISNSYQAIGGLFNINTFKPVNASNTEFFDSEYNTNNFNEMIVEEEEEEIDSFESNDSIINIPNGRDDDDDESDSTQASNLSNLNITSKASNQSITFESVSPQTSKLSNLNISSKASTQSVNFESVSPQASKLSNLNITSKASSQSVNFEIENPQTSKLSNSNISSKASTQSVNFEIENLHKSKLSNNNISSKASTQSVNFESESPHTSKLSNSNISSKASTQSVNFESESPHTSKLSKKNIASKASSQSVNFESESPHTSKLSKKNASAKSSNRSIKINANNKNSPNNRPASRSSNKEISSKASNRRINNESENRQKSKSSNKNIASKASNRKINPNISSSTIDSNNNTPEKPQASKLKNKDDASKASNRSNINDNNNINEEPESPQASKLINEDNLSKASNRSIIFDMNNDNNNNNNNDDDDEPETPQASKLSNEDDASKASNRSINLNMNNNNNNGNDDNNNNGDNEVPESAQASKLSSKDDASKASNRSIDFNMNGIDNDEPENRQTTKLSNKNSFSNASNRSLNYNLISNTDHRIQGIMSIYDANLLSQNKPELFHNIILDSIYFAFNCLDATEYINSAFGTNFVIGIGINVGGPCTAGTLGDEHMQFSVVGEAVKTSYAVCNTAEAGNIVISNDVYELLKESSEAQKNFVFEKYKEVELPHSKKTQTYLTKLSDVFKQETQLEDSNENNEPLSPKNSLVKLQNANDLVDQQISPPDE